MLAEDKSRIVRLLAGLRAEGEPLPLLLWMVSEELRNLLRLQQAVAAGRPFATAVRSVRLSFATCPGGAGTAARNKRPDCRPARALR